MKNTPDQRDLFNADSLPATSAPSGAGVALSALEQQRQEAVKPLCYHWGIAKTTREWRLLEAWLEALASHANLHGLTDVQDECSHLAAIAMHRRLMQAKTTRDAIRGILS